MFAQLDTRNGSRRRRACTTLLSFAGEAVLLALVIASPLLYTSALPRIALAPPTVLSPPPAMAASHAPQPLPHGAAIVSQMQGMHLLPPSRVPLHAINLVEVQPPMQPGSDGRGVPGGTGTDPSGVPYGLAGPGAPPPPPPLPSPPRAPVRISNPEPADILNRVQPLYPPAAKLAHVQGPVIVSALIARDGSIERLHVVSGHPLLAPAALDAIRQWRFRPYRLNGEAMEVETQITVNFVLAPLN